MSKALFTLFFWFAAMTYVQCFVLCFREEGPRAVTALYFGWPAFRNRHFVISGGGGLQELESYLKRHAPEVVSQFVSVGPAFSNFGLLFPLVCQCGNSVWSSNRSWLFALWYYSWVCAAAVLHGSGGVPRAYVQHPEASRT